MAKDDFPLEKWPNRLTGFSIRSGNGVADDVSGPPVRHLWTSQNSRIVAISSLGTLQVSTAHGRDYVCRQRPSGRRRHVGLISESFNKSLIAFRIAERNKEGEVRAR